MDLAHRLKTLHMGIFCSRINIINDLLIYNYLDGAYSGFRFRIWQYVNSHHYVMLTGRKFQLKAGMGRFIFNLKQWRIIPALRRRYYEYT
jgi:hypothetical protein